MTDHIRDRLAEMMYCDGKTFCTPREHADAIAPAIAELVEAAQAFLHYDTDVYSDEVTIMNNYAKAIELAVAALSPFIGEQK